MQRVQRRVYPQLRARTRLSIAQSPQSDFASPVVRIGYSSLVTPFSIIDVNMVTGAFAYALGVPDESRPKHGRHGRLQPGWPANTGLVMWICTSLDCYWLACAADDGRNMRPVRAVETVAGNAAVMKVMVIEGGYDSELYQADQVCKLAARRTRCHVLCLL